MAHGAAAAGDRVTAAPPPQAYPEWPEGLGDPQPHVVDGSNAQKASGRSRKEIIAQFRARQPTTANASSRVPKTKNPHTRDYEDAQFPVRKCSVQVHCHRGRASKKCHSCAKFDEQKAGYYCDACFDAHHPAYRLAHSWIPIEDDVNQYQEWAAHITRLKLEQDAQELQFLLSETQQFLQYPRISSVTEPPPPTPHGSSKTARRKLSTLVIPPPFKQQPPPTADPPLHKASGEIDFRATYTAMASLQGTLRGLIEQIHSELERRPPLTKTEALLKIQRMWKLRAARKQLRALVRSVYASFQDPLTGETYYYNSKTNTTQWTKPKALDDSEELQEDKSIHMKKTDSVSSQRETLKVKRVFNSREEQELDAVLKIQGMLRTHKARVHMRKLISSTYEKIWDASSARFYYHNTRSKQVKWDKPRWVNDADLLTPRSRQQQVDEELKQHRLEALRLVMTEDCAATMLQRAYRRKKGFESLVKLCRQVYERIFDPSANAFYYHNTRTKETSWDKPAILRGVHVDVFTPRTRQQQLERSAMVIAAASSLDKEPKKKKKTVSVHHEWTEQQAAACLQGLYRTRQAKRQLDTRLAQVYRKVKDADSGRFYYVNLMTQAVSWEPPALLLKSSIDVDEFQ